MTYSRMSITYLMEEKERAPSPYPVPNDRRSRREFQRTWQLHARLDKQLRSARRYAIKTFAADHGWKFEGHFGLSELHGDSPHLSWCETCGWFCGEGVNMRTNGHRNGQHDAFTLKRGGFGRTCAIILHTEHPFSKVEIFGKFLDLSVTELEWSWYGKPTAALLERKAFVAPTNAPPTFRIGDGERPAVAVAAILQDLVKQNRSNTRWRWANGKPIDDRSTLKAITGRALFEEFDTVTRSWQRVPCPMGLAMSVGSLLYFCGGRP